MILNRYKYYRCGAPEKNIIHAIAMFQKICRTIDKTVSSFGASTGAVSSPAGDNLERNSCFYI